jgi:hypothetical protein
MSGRNLLAMVLTVAAACSGDKRGAIKKIDVAPSDSAQTATMTPVSPEPTSTSTHSAFVGSRYDPMPNGVSYESGSVILDRDGKPSRFVLSHVRTPKGSMLWLDEMLADEGATRRRVVRAVMDDPTLSPGERLMIGTCGARGGRFSGDVIATVNGKSASPQTAIRAWRANPATSRFESIPTNDVVCEEPAG